MTRTEYYDAYGVHKSRTTRGKIEYDGREKRDALNNLRKLADTEFLVTYSRKLWLRDEERSKAIRGKTTIIKILEGYDNLLPEELSRIERGEDIESRATEVVWQASPLLVDQIDSYFLLKPNSYYDEIKQVAGRSSKYFTTFIDYLYTRAEDIRRSNARKYQHLNSFTDPKLADTWILQIDEHNLAEILRMYSYIKSRNWKRIRNTVGSCYALAKKLGYITEAGTADGITKPYERIVLNPSKFHEIRKRTETEPGMLEVSAGQVDG